MNEDYSVNLNQLNRKRVETTKLRVAHAINLLNNPIACLNEGRFITTATNDIAHAINLLEAANEEMQWACEYFKWDMSICDLIDDACVYLGQCLACLVNTDKKYDPEFVAIDGKIGLAKLAKALATLVRWNDDTVNVSEI